MANDLSDIMPKILARGLLALREAAVMPRLVNLDYSMEAAERGDTIDVPIPVAVSVINVTPAATPPTPADTTPSKVQITLDKWKQNEPFHLTDKQLVEIDRNAHFLPMQMSEAIRAIANQINADVLAEYTGVYGYVGTAGTTPFTSDATAATQAVVTLDQQLCVGENRRAVIDFTAKAKFLDLSSFSDAEKIGSSEVKIRGEMGEKYGLNFFADHAVPLHTAGTGSGATTDTAGYAVGVKTVTLASAGTGTILVGDIITFAGDTQTYVITSGDSDVSNGGTISFEPGLKTAIATSATAITLKASHRVNLAFHRDAFALATRPLLSSTVDLQLGHQILSAQDPVTGLILRLEVSRQHKQTVWEFDALYGVKLVRRELACRIAG